MEDKQPPTDASDGGGKREEKVGWNLIGWRDHIVDLCTDLRSLIGVLNGLDHFASRFQVSVKEIRAKKDDSGRSGNLQVTVDSLLVRHLIYECVYLSDVLYLVSLSLSLLVYQFWFFVLYSVCC